MTARRAVSRRRTLTAAIAALAGCTAGSSFDPHRSGAAAPPPAGPTYAGALESVADVQVQERGWRFAGHDGRIMDTPHYRIYTTLSRQGLLERLPLFMERALDQYSSGLARLPKPPTRMETYLLETRNQWEAKTRQMLPDQASTFLTLGRGGFTTRGTSVLYYIGPTDTLSIAAHEGWHQYSQRLFASQLPLWLEEGIATYMEGFVSHPDGLPKFRPWANLERYHALRDAANDDRLIPLEALLERTPQSYLETGRHRLLTYYAQVWALAHYLAEGGGGRHRGALERLLTDAVQGRLGGGDGPPSRRRSATPRLGPEVLLAYFGPDLATFEAGYLAFVRDVVRTGGRDRVVRGESPQE